MTEQQVPMTNIPDGFLPWVPSSPFLSHIAAIGPIYQRESDSVLGLRIQNEHANMHDIAHGGLLATMVDCALGYYISHACKASVVTVNMSLDYLNAAKIGDWMEAHVKMEKRGRKLIFATCLLQTGGTTLVKANGIFAARTARSPASDA